MGHIQGWKRFREAVTSLDVSGCESKLKPFDCGHILNCSGKAAHFCFFRLNFLLSGSYQGWTFKKLLRAGLFLLCAAQAIRGLRLHAVLVSNQNGETLPSALLRAGFASLRR